ncbi:MAG: hypothetical protein LIP01_09560 [Tannerellaceae bacterium]|nr:hypothetical protein [Tannerellaceae bacterium]
MFFSLPSFYEPDISFRIYPARQRLLPGQQTLPGRVVNVRYLGGKATCSVPYPNKNGI